ncbi:MAG: hypothetical protein E7I42_23290 [Pluralibacter gergoviae]|nr:hypothetical protein [Pluralibacter gergoviae]
MIKITIHFFQIAPGASLLTIEPVKRMIARQAASLAKDLKIIAKSMISRTHYSAANFHFKNEFRALPALFIRRPRAGVI